MSNVIDLLLASTEETKVLSNGGLKCVTDALSFPLCVSRREGEGVRVFWDRLREPSFSSRWNPFATDFPFITFTYHPVRNINDTFAALCDVSWLVKSYSGALFKVYSKSQKRDFYLHVALKRVVVLFADVLRYLLQWRRKEFICSLSSIENGGKKKKKSQQHFLTGTISWLLRRILIPLCQQLSLGVFPVKS